MVATTANSSLSPLSSKLGWFKSSKSDNFKTSLNIRASLQGPSYVNGNSLRVDDVSSRTLTNQLSNLSMFLGSITTIFTEKPNETNGDFSRVIAAFGIDAKFAENGLVFCQNFSIRSYEVGANGIISMETLISHLQETGLNHMKVTGLIGDGLGSTPEMCKRNLIWVSTKMQVVVDRYPTWGDTIQVDNWLVLSGKNSLRRDSLIRDGRTGELLGRATCNWVMMNKETRRLCRFPLEVREEMSPFCKVAPPILEDDGRKSLNLDDTSFDHSCTGLKPRWSDLDINQHVNNAKYIGWILESAPESTMKTHKLSRMTLEYKRECHRESVLRSMTTISSNNVDRLNSSEHVECHHVLSLESGGIIMKARTEWSPKHANNV